MLIQNAYILREDFRFAKGDLPLKEGKFALSAADDTEKMDLTGYYVVPGLVDMHIHGLAGCNVLEADWRQLNDMSVELARRGITSFVPTLAAADKETTLQALERLSEAAERGLAGATVQGLYLEGPFLSPQYPGAMRRECLRLPDIEELKAYIAAARGWLRVVTIAPELPGSDALIRLCTENGITAAAGHTEADYEQAMKAFYVGAAHVTHLYNAMAGQHHRQPGIAGAVSDSTVTAELICDGFHVHPAVVRQIYRWLGKERMVFVSDAIPMAGLPDGVYEMDGQISIIQDGVSRLENGAINGNTHDLLFCVRQGIAFGIPPEAAWQMGTHNPARAIGRQNFIGSIKPGMQADFLVLDADWSMKMVWIGGRLFHSV